jgi:hypothetical protein
MRDAGKEYYGPAVVSGRILEANKKDNVLTEITGCKVKGGKTIVTA